MEHFLLRLMWTVVASNDIYFFLCACIWIACVLIASPFWAIQMPQKDELTVRKVIMRCELMKKWRRLERLSESHLFLMGGALLIWYKSFAIGQTLQTTAILASWWQQKSLRLTKDVLYTYRLMLSGICYLSDSDICSSLCTTSFLIALLSCQDCEACLMRATDQALVLTCPLWSVKGHGHWSKCHARCVGTCLSVY